MSVLGYCGNGNFFCGITIGSIMKNVTLLLLLLDSQGNDTVDRVDLQW